jgi:hypothetical protein
MRIIELSDSAVKAFVIPRLQLKNAKVREELLKPSLYFLLSSSESIGYIGESENFFHRVKNHDQNKQFWDVAVAIVSTTNALEKSDVKYLESLAVERAQSGSMTIENKTIPSRNNVHEFKLHTLQKILDDTQLILTSLGYDIFTSPNVKEDTWICRVKNTEARAQFRGDKFVLLQGSRIDKSFAPSWGKFWTKSLAERDEIFKRSGRDLGDIIELTENVAFKSPNHAAGFATGRSVNAWLIWKDESGQTMDEVMRK